MAYVVVRKCPLGTWEDPRTVAETPEKCREIVKELDQPLTSKLNYDAHRPWRIRRVKE